MAGKAGKREKNYLHIVTGISAPNTRLLIFDLGIVLVDSIFGATLTQEAAPDGLNNLNSKLMDGTGYMHVRLADTVKRGSP